MQVELVDALFAQPHWAAQAEVAAAAAAIADLQRKGNESSQHGATYARAEQQLQAADARLAEAEQHMGTAQFIGRVEMMDNIIDPWQRRHPMDDMLRWPKSRARMMRCSGPHSTWRRRGMCCLRCPG